MTLFAVPTAATASRPVRVAIVADHGLIAEAVRAALMGRGYDVVVVRWPTARPKPTPRPRRSRRRSVGPPPDVALMLSELESTELVRTAQSFVEGLDVPWLVLTGAPRGPAWGALYESGATLVVSAQTRLDVTCDLMEDLADGRTPRTGRRRRRELIRTWRTFAQRREDLALRLAALTEREREVLRQLYAGLAVRDIAERSEVTEATVRSQVKAILRKLEVNSQLAAVAAYEDVLTDSTDDCVPADPRRVDVGAKG